MPLYGNELDRDDEPVRGRPRSGREAREARRLRRPRGAREGRRGRPGRSGSSGCRSRAGGSPATATRCWPATAAPASSPAAPTRRRWASPSRWPTSRRAMREPGTILAVEVREQPVSAEVVPLPFYKRGPSHRAASAAPPDAPTRRGDGMVPADLRYTKDHEWVRVDGDAATIGVTDFAANQLGDVVFVDLPAVGQDGRAVRDVRRRRVGQGRERPVRAASRARSSRSTATWPASRSS